MKSIHPSELSEQNDATLNAAVTKLRADFEQTAFLNIPLVNRERGTTDQPERYLQELFKLRFASKEQQKAPVLFDWFKLDIIFQKEFFLSLTERERLALVFTRMEFPGKKHNKPIAAGISTLGLSLIIGCLCGMIQTKSTIWFAAFATNCIVGVKILSMAYDYYKSTSKGINKYEGNDLLAIQMTDLATVQSVYRKEAEWQKKPMDHRKMVELQEANSALEAIGLGA